MKCCSMLPAGLSLTAAVLLAAATSARDWPTFGGTPQRNMVNPTAKDVPTSWSVQPGKQKNVKWVIDLGDHAYGGPTIADGRIFVGTNNANPRNPAIKGDKGVVMCFREADGQLLWQAVHDKLPNPQANDWPQQGVASTPAVDGDRVYYVSNRCELVCASVAGGDNKEAKFLWRLDMIKDLDVFARQLASSSPLVVGNLVYLLTGNGVDEEFKVASPKAPSFLAVDKMTGKVVWQSDLPGGKIMDGQWTNPAYAEVNGKGQVIFPGGDGWLYGLDAKTGTLVWKFNANRTDADYKPGGGGNRNYFIATPVVHDNKVYIGTGRNPEDGDRVAYLWCIDITKTGDLSPVNNNFDPKAPENKDSGLVWFFGGPSDPKFAEETGRDWYFGRSMSTCAIHDGILYTADTPGFVYCLDARTGQKLWEHDTKGDIWGSPLVVDGKMYIANGNGDVFIFAHGREKKLLDTIEMKDRMYSTPVVANGVLYLMTMSKLYAIASK